MTLKTRKPTGAVPWPLILVEGEEKSGKSYACAVLSASPRVGQTLWLDLNEGAADEYIAVPGARYEVIDHDGSWQSITGQLADAKAEAVRAKDAGEKPVALVIDTGTAEWDLLKAWADSRARLTDANKRKLAADANAEIQIPMNLWNDANSRHRKFMTILMTFPGIVVITARGKDVAALDAKGSPIAGTKEYKVEGNKTLAYDVSCWVRTFRDKPAIVVGARSVHNGVRPGKDKPRELDPDWTLEGLIFDALRCDPAGAHVRNLAETRPARTPSEILNQALRPATDFDGVKELYAEAQEAGYDEVVIVNEQQESDLLLKFLFRIGDEKRGGGKPAGDGASRPARPAAVPDNAPAAEEPWIDQALAAAPNLPTVKACQDMWRVSAAKVQGGVITRADAQGVQEILRARMEDLRREAAALDPEDPWSVKVESLAGEQDAADAVDEVLRSYHEGRATADRKDALIAAITARFPGATAEAVAA